MTRFRNPSLQRAIEIVGSQSKLAKMIGVRSQAAISRALLGEVKLSAELAVAVEAATAGQVPRWQLRPDLWAAPWSTYSLPEPEQKQEARA
ncbi:MULTISPECIES: YdaS family helix-turn-helix protein [unclassified Chelatococcus]|uniref:transcriptional regulator n=1 Tax=unclassified Chelatococcus TaxID=2638111 RepID=UPI001BD04B3A|nr:MULTISPECIES: YdaS family helix-turn-helix protein [unclassified Chelatococcus]MBS7696250.1 helix-turn-helix domain-containing protein [Chelatococcus sp. YT9]MBX3560078.1 helix-turn-helix domain-containing protein [Chelatococcus sp.]